MTYGSIVKSVIMGAIMMALIGFTLSAQAAQDMDKDRVEKPAPLSIQERSMNEGKARVVLSAQRTGQIRDVLKDKGDSIKKGETVIRFSCDEVNAQARAAQAEFESSEQAYLNLIQLKDLDAASGYEVDQARLTLKKHQAMRDAHSADLSSCLIKAPFSGTVEAVLIQPHETARMGQALVEIQSTQE